MANLPEQVQRQIEAAEATLAEIASASQATEQPATTVQESVEAQSPTNVTPIQQTTQDDPNSETYAQRWRSLQGIHNSTIRQNRELAGRVQQLEQMLSALNTTSTQQQPQQISQQRLITEADEKEYGDSLDVMRRVAREELAPIVDQFRSSISSLSNNVSSQVQQVASKQHATQEELFYEKLTNIVPNWRSINSNSGFHEWLSEVDPLTGIQRQVYLEDAHRVLDVNRVATFFMKWNEAVSAKQAPQTTQPLNVPPTRTAASELERQIAPGRTRVITTPVQTDQRVFHRSEIAKFYDDVRRGLYRGKEPEMRRIETDIIAAAKDNRVVAG